MGGVLTRTAEPADAFRITLRAEDLEEARLYPGSVRSNLLRSILNSLPTAFTAVDGDGRVLAIGGLRKAGKLGHPWLMCSEAATAHPRALLTAGRWMVSECRASHLSIWNVVGKRSTKNQSFLRRLGFVIEPGPEGHPFDRFHLP